MQRKVTFEIFDFHKVVHRSMRVEARWDENWVHLSAINDDHEPKIGCSLGIHVGKVKAFWVGVDENGKRFDGEVILYDANKEFAVSDEEYEIERQELERRELENDEATGSV